MTTTGTIEVLQALAERSTEDNPDLSAATGVIGDVGRVLATLDEPAVRELQSAIATVRERLEYSPGSVEQRPVDALRQEKSHFFLAGALWAANDIMSALLAEHADRKRRYEQLSERACLRKIALDLLEMQSAITPSDVSEHAEKHGLTVKADRVSKALGDLLVDGSIISASTPADADRRVRRFVRATPATTVTG